MHGLASFISLEGEKSNFPIVVGRSGRAIAMAVAGDFNTVAGQPILPYKPQTLGR